MSEQIKKVVVIDAGTSDPSTTQMLANATLQRVIAEGAAGGVEIEGHSISLKRLANDIATGLTTGIQTAEIEKAAQLLLKADAIIASTPIYKAGPSALFTGFLQILDNDLLIGKPVILAATAGSERHSLVLDAQIRPLFAYLRTVPVATSLFATSEDWGSNDFTERITRAAHELLPLIAADYANKIRENSWGAYQHSYGSAGGTETSIDFDTDLMRLATGG